MSAGMSFKFLLCSKLHMRLDSSPCMYAYLLHVGAWALQLCADEPDSNFAALSISIHCCVVQAIVTPCISCVQSESSSELLVEILYNGVRVQLPGCSSTEGASCTLQAFEVQALLAICILLPCTWLCP